MKRTIAKIFVLSMGIFTGILFLREAIAQEVECDTTITSVVIYRERAVVTRSLNLAKYNLAKGKHSLLIDKLPYSLEPGSLKVKTLSNSSVIVLGVDIEAYQIDETLEQIEKEIIVLSEKLQIVEIELDVALEKIVLLKSAELAKNIKDSSVDLNGILNVFAKQLKDEILAKEKLAVEKEVLNKKIEEFKKRKEKLEVKKKVFKAKVDIEIKEDNEAADICVIYEVSNSGWDIEYDVRVLLEEDKVEITSYAYVWQNSGEEWKDVILTVNSGKVESLLHFSTERVDKAVEFSDFVKEYKMRHVKQLHKETPLENFSYALGQEKTLKSDGEPVKFIIKTHMLRLEYKYLVFPEVSSAVFSVVRMINNTGMPYLNGKAKIFIGVNYNGEGSVPLTYPGDNMEIFIRKEDDIVVKKQLIKRELKEDGLFKKVTKTYMLQYEIEFKDLSEDQDYKILEMVDYFTVFFDETEVSVETIDAKPLVVDTDKGIIRWNVELFPGTEGKISYNLVFHRKD